MKKKKVDKILKGVVTAGVALGGASFMTEADMVYAAETEDTTEKEEKVEELENPEVDEEKPEVLTETQNAPAEETKEEKEEAKEEKKEEKEEAKQEKSEEKEEAKQEKSEEKEEAKQEKSEEKEEAKEEKKAKAVPAEGETPAEEPASEEGETPADGEAPAEVKAPMLRMAKAASPETTQPPVTNEAYDKAVNAVTNDHQKIQDADKFSNWNMHRQYVQDYAVADLASKGATDIAVTLDWNNKIDNERNIKLVYLDADGAFKTEYVQYKALDANGEIITNGNPTKSVLIMQSNVVEDEGEGDLDINGTNEIARVDIANKTADSLKEDFDKQLQETVDNASEKSEDAFSTAIDRLNKAMRKVAETKDWVNWREVTYAYANALIVSNGGTVSDEVNWVSISNAQDMHYGEIKYVDKEGNSKSAFYDYVCLTDKGELNTKEATGKAIIVEKTPIYENGKLVGFASYEGNEVPQEVKGVQDKINEVKKGRGIVKLSTITTDLLEKAIKSLSDNKPVSNQSTDDTSNNGGGQSQDGPVVPGETPTDGGETNEPGTGDTNQPTGDGTGEGTQSGAGTSDATGGSDSGETNEPGTGDTNQPTGEAAGEGAQPDAGTSDTTGGTAGGATQQTTDTTDTSDDTEPQPQETVQIPAQQTTQAEAPAQEVTTIENSTVPATDSVNNDSATNDTSAASENGQNNAENNGAGETQQGQDRATLDDGQVPLSVGKTDVADENIKIGENELPQSANAAVIDEKISWWWLLLILLFGAAGKKMYEDHKKKVAAKAEANNQDK